jgi:nicotinamidase-related amidase
VFRSADDKPREIPGGSALLIVDVQEGFVNEATRPILPLITHLVETCHDAISHIYASRYINREDSPCRLLLGYEALSDPSETALRPEVEAFEPLVFEKATYAIGMPLTIRLRTDGVQTLLLVGVDTHACVLHEAVDAFDRTVRPIVLADLCASGDGEEAHRAALTVMRQGIGVHNVWFGAPEAPRAGAQRLARHS